MVTGFEVFGAVASTIALLNLAQQGLRNFVETKEEFENFGPNTENFRLSCEQLYLDVRNWSNFWGFHIPTTREEYAGFWGEDDRDIIEKRLDDITEKCADFAVMVVKALPPMQTYDQIPKSDQERIRAYLKRRTPRTKFGGHSRSRLLQKIWPRPLSEIKEYTHSRRAREQRILEEKIKRSTSAWKRTKYVLWSSKKLQKQLDAIRHDFVSLRETTKMAWHSQHTGVDLKTLTHDERRVKALSRTRLFVLEDTKQDRVEYKALYGRCAISPEAPKLELNLFDHSVGAAKRKRFRLMVPLIQNNTQMEISAEILRESPPLTIKERDNFKDACQKVYTDGEGLLRIRKDDHQGSSRNLGDSRDRLWRFSFCRLAEPLQVREFEVASLSDKLKMLALAERLNLAYRVAESGLTLLGTPWLSTLCATTLERFKNLKVHEQEPQYLLSIKGSRNRLHLRVDNVVLKNYKLHPYIFTIGAVLVEIGLQLIVIDVRRGVEGLELLTIESRTPIWSSTGRIVSLVDKEMGSAFSEAVEFCLQDPVTASNHKWKKRVLYDGSRSEEEISMQLLDLFFENVLVKCDPQHPSGARNVN